VAGVLSEGELTMMDDGEYTFALGVTPIYSIQYVDDLLQDDSDYMDIVATRRAAWRRWRQLLLPAGGGRGGPSSTSTCASRRTARWRWATACGSPAPSASTTARRTLASSRAWLLYENLGTPPRRW